MSSTIALGILVVHKVAIDALGSYTRTHGESYSATTASLFGEVAKLPVLYLAISISEGRNGVGRIVRDAFTKKPYDLCLPSLFYTVQGLLYFWSLSNMSVAGYQILSQTKLLFTAGLMRVMLNKRLSFGQYTALFLLLAGSLLTQVAELGKGGRTGGNALLGGALAVLGAFLSSFPNVYYEKILKTEGESQWARNVQLTFWISFWLVVIGGLEVLFQSPTAPKLDCAGIVGRPEVWLLIVLQSLKCIVIPMTLKYADNILYSYAKPASIFLTTLCAWLIFGQRPRPLLFLGGALVLVSMGLYNGSASKTGVSSSSSSSSSAS